MFMLEHSYVKTREFRNTKITNAVPAINRADIEL